MIILFRELNCVYQFHGCYFHGCPICKPDNRDDKSKGKSLNEKFIKTKEIEQYIKECGFDLKTIWECEFKEFRKNNSISNKYLYPTESLCRMDETLVLDLIKSNKIFGAVEVNIHVPENLKNYFEELTPIFKTQ